MIYLDNNATTPILKEVVEAMMIDLDGKPRNPSAMTTLGREGKALITAARNKIADLFGVTPTEVIFTSGATEGNLMLINGFNAIYPGHILSTAIEHTSVLKPLENLKAPLTQVKVGPHGAPKPEQVLEAIRKDTSLLVFTAANNVTGVKLDIDGICQIAREKRIPLIIDGTVMLNRVPICSLPEEIGAISFSGHKISGPKGIGFVILRKKHRIPPLLLGGTQENNMRAGTENIAGILGLAKAVEMINDEDIAYVGVLRDTFERRLIEEGIKIEINGEGERVPNTTNIHFIRQDAEMMVIRLDQKGLIASVGSACSAGTIHVSYVLREMGYKNKQLRSSIRFSFAKQNTLEEVEKSVQLIKEVVS